MNTDSTIRYVISQTGKRGKEMKGMKKIITSTVLILMLLLLCVSCNNAVEETTGVGYINLSDVVTDDVSRGLVEDDSANYKVEDLYWTYTAVKTGPTPIRDTTGVTRVGEEKVVSYLGDSEDKDFSHNQGLSNNVIGPLAVGTWKITVYGYLYNTEPDGDGYAAKKQDTGNVLIYTGETDGNQRIDACEKDNARDRSKNKIGPIQLKSPETLNGYLRFEEDAFSLKVPENMEFFYDGTDTSEIIVKVFDKTESNAVEIAKSVTPLDVNRLYKSGEEIELNDFVFTTTAVETLKDGKIYHLFKPGVHKFELIVEYRDTWTKGSNEYDGSERYKDGTFYDKDYAPVGDIITFPLKSVGGLKVVLSGDVNDIKANGGEVGMVKFAVADCAIIYWKDDGTKDTSKTPEYFETLQAAITRWLSLDSIPVRNRRITLLNDIDNVGEVSTLNKAGTGGTDIYIYSADPEGNQHYIDNVKLTGGSGRLKICVPEGDYEAVYTFENSTENPVIRNFSSKKSTSGVTSVWITMDKGDVTVKAKDHTVYLSGKIGNVNVGDSTSDNTYSPDVKIGTDAAATVDWLIVKNGKVELGGYVSVDKLALDFGINKDNSALKGQTTTKVGNIDKIVSGRIYDAEKNERNMEGYENVLGLFRKIILKANNGTDASRPLNGIEGMYMKLPDFGTDTVTSGWRKTEAGSGVKYSFMLWNTKADITGTSYDNCATLVTPASDTTLHAIWAQPLGGKVFYINATGGWTALDSYHFFGAQKREIGLWKGSSDIAKALSGAVYGLNTAAGSGSDRVYIAYATVNSVSGEEEVSVYGDENTCFKDHGKTDFLKDDDLGKGKENTEKVLNEVSLDGEEKSVFARIKQMRAADGVNGQKDWYVGSFTDYLNLTRSSLKRPPRITSLTVVTDGGKVKTYTGTEFDSSWTDQPYGEGHRAFLVPLRSF